MKRATFNAIIVGLPAAAKVKPKQIEDLPRVTRVPIPDPYNNYLGLFEKHDNFSDALEDYIGRVKQKR